MHTQLRSIPRPNTRHTFYPLNLRQVGHLPRPIFTRKQWLLIGGAGVYLGFFVYCVIELVKIALTF